MKIIQQITSDGEFNEAITNLELYGISVSAQFFKSGLFLIDHMPADRFVRQLPKEPIPIALNFCLSSEERLSQDNYTNIASMLSKVTTSSDIILSSYFPESREGLHKIRLAMIGMCEGDRPCRELLIATLDDLPNDKRKSPNDMVIFSTTEPFDPYKHSQLNRLVRNGDPILIHDTKANMTMTEDHISNPITRNKFLLLTKTPDSALKTYGNK